MYRLFLIIIGCYLLVRFIFGFVIPVVRTMLTVRKKMHEMQGHMSNQAQQSTNQNGYQSNSTETNKTAAKTSSKDYIDFEEIK